MTPSHSMDEFALHNGSGVVSLNNSDPHYSLHPHQDTAVAASEQNNQYGDGFDRGNHYNFSNTAYESHSGSSTNQQYRRSLAEGINGDEGDQQYRGIQTNSNDDEGNDNSTINTSKMSVFVQESPNNSGEIQWSCRHCNCMPYSFRAPGSIFKGPDPPNFAFIEQHLSVCRGNMRYYHGDESVSGNDPGDKNKLGSSTGSNPNSGYGYGGNIYPQCHQVSHMYNGMNPVYGQHHGYGYIHPPQAGGGAGYSSDGYFKGNRNDLQNDMISPFPSGQGYPHHPGNAPRDIPELSSGDARPGSLAKTEDRLLLTDYFFYLMQQLQVCHFSETDRKTRGGKRDNIATGYGGMQCIHCAGRPDARKFFWSDVDRLANSFAEIPSHIIRCKRAPPDVKTNLGFLKSKHPEQMARLPRGSQKVFFRRMWRRLHGHGTEFGEKELSNHPASKDRVLLAISEDADWLSDVDCFVRKQLEVFCATKADIEKVKTERKYPVSIGQVGIRCIYCAHSAGGAHGSAVNYPSGIGSIYECVREFQKVHIESCPNIPDPVRTRLKSLTKTSTSLTSVLRRYYILAAKALGMVESSDGIRSDLGLRRIDENVNPIEVDRKRSANDADLYDYNAANRQQYGRYSHNYNPSSGPYF